MDYLQKYHEAKGMYYIYICIYKNKKHKQWRENVSRNFGISARDREKLFGVRSLKHYPLRSIWKWVIEQCPAREETSREEMTG